MIRTYCAIVLLLSIVGCTSNANKAGESNATVPDSVFTPQFAQGFSIEYYPDYKIIKVKDLFDSLRQEQTICVSSNKSIDRTKIVAAQFIDNSSVRWVTLSSTHISPANLLDIKNSIIGVAEPHYISDSTIVQGVKNGTIRNVGMAMAPDLEVILALTPSFVMVSPFPDITYGQIKNSGIAVVPNASYLETTPLARAEWIVFVASLFDKETAARGLFKNIVRRYNDVQKIAKKAAYRPTIFSGHLYQGIWYTSMGQNYMANYYENAGADYIYKNVKGTGTMNLEFERVYMDASNAEYWLLILNHPGELTYDVIKQMDERYCEFAAFKNKKIICTNAYSSLFFERAEQEPDVVLADLTYALHPDLNPTYQPVYFKTLK